MAAPAKRTGVAVGRNSGHITTRRELPPSISRRKGVRDHDEEDGAGRGWAMVMDDWPKARDGQGDAAGTVLLDAGALHGTSDGATGGAIGSAMCADGWEAPGAG